MFFKMKKTLRDVDIRGKRILVRVDFNVPIKNGEIKDDTRIRAAVPTIEYALQQDAKVILASHLGRPLKEQKKAAEAGREFNQSAFSLRTVAARLGELIGRNVEFVSDCVGDSAQSACSNLAGGTVLLLENLRFHEGEEKNDAAFARELGALCEVFVNDAFGAAHRAHASTEGITHFVSQSVAGLLMAKELEFLGRTLDNPLRPFVAILGGAKVSDKIPVIESLIKRKVDKLLIGGAMAYTFLKANGYTVGKSLVEDELMPKALETEEAARLAGTEIILPSDHQVVDSYDPLNSRKTIPVDFTNTGLVGLDIGTETVERFSAVIKGAKTILWNGPMGMFEEEPFDQGTIGIALAVAEATRNGAISIVGGGDSVAALNKAGVGKEITHVSTGGGATLEFLAGTPLPGVEALEEIQT
mgnify:CR=1 FL=1